MRKRAIYAECHSQLWLDIARRLSSDAGLEPCYWVGKRVFEPRVRAAFPSAVFHARTDAIRGVPPPSGAPPLEPLDAESIADYAGVLVTAGKMMDRLDVGNAFRYDERTRLAQLQLCYWGSVVRHFRPDVVMFPVQPHTLYDYVLYEVCQREGVPTLMFQWTLFTDWLYPLDHIERGYGELSRAYDKRLAEAEAPVLGERLEAYLARVQGTYADAVPNYLRRLMPDDLRVALFSSDARMAGDSGLVAAAALNPPAAPPEDLPSRPAPDRAAQPKWWPPKRARKTMRGVRSRAERATHDSLHSARKRASRRLKHAVRSLESVRHAVRAKNRKRAGRWLTQAPGRMRKSAWQFYKRWFRFITYAVIHGDADRPLKQPGRPFAESFRGRRGAVRLQIARLKGARYKRELFQRYSEHVRDPEFDKPFVFVALHYQPEQTTCPTGGVFMDQLLMVKMLSALVPPDWRVYVKEHPYQFFASGVGERGRTADLYDDMAALPNVTLLPWSASPFPLIDRAQAVATVTGTTGIEAAMRGTPVLVFGYAWYRACDGVFYTPTAAACAAALEAIANGFTVDPRKVRAYLAAVEDVSFRADLNFGEKIEPIPHDENVRVLSDAILRRLADAPASEPAARVG